VEDFVRTIKEMEPPLLYQKVDTDEAHADIEHLRLCKIISSHLEKVRMILSLAAERSQQHSGESIESQGDGGI